MDNLLTMDIRGTKIEKIIKKKNRIILVTAIMIFLFGILLFVPIILSISAMKGDYFSAGNFIAILISLAIVGCACYGFYLYYTRTADLNDHPAVKKFLSFKDSKSLIGLFEEEINGPPIKSCKGLSSSGYITQNFVVFESLFNFRWGHLTEIVWVYPRLTSYTVDYVPIDSTSGVIIQLADGNKFEFEFSGEMDISGKKGRAAANEFYSTLLTMVPFAFFGYSRELASRWANDREKFISEVRKRMRSEVKPYGHH